MWYSVKKRKPPKYTREIFVYSVNGNMHVLRRGYDDWHLWEWDGGGIGREVEFTHWRHLPNEPRTRK